MSFSKGYACPKHGALSHIPKICPECGRQAVSAKLKWTDSGDVVVSRSLTDKEAGVIIFLVWAVLIIWGAQ